MVTGRSMVSAGCAWDRRTKHNATTNDPTHGDKRRKRDVMPALPPGLDLGPQPIDQALGLLVMGGDDVEALHRFGIRIDGEVVEHGLVDERLARQIAVGVT